MLTFMHHVRTKTPEHVWYLSWRHMPLHGATGPLGSEQLGPALIAATVLRSFAAGALATLAVIAGSTQGWLS